MRQVALTAVSVAVAAAALTGASAAHAASPPASLSGAGHGTWQVQPGNPDTGTQRLLHGHGTFTIGKAKVRGSVTSPGFIANGDCTVSLRLVTATGKLVLNGHTPRSSSSYPTCVGNTYRFRFHTVKASGDLTGASYKGVGHFDLENASSDVTDSGTFTLRLKPRS
jgi:hypothetical protein